MGVSDAWAAPTVGTAHKPELSWRQVAATGLAAMSSAVLLSTLGVAGTIIGAALGSVLLTVGSKLYEHYLQISRDRALRAVQTLGWTRRTSGVSAVGRAEQLARTEAQQQPAPRGRLAVPWRELLHRLRWQRALLASAGVFAVVMGAILSFELLTGRALSSYTGGSQADGPRTSIPLPGVASAGDDGTGGTGREPGEPAPAGDATGAPDTEPTGEDLPTVPPTAVAPREIRITELPPPARTPASAPASTTRPTSGPAAPIPSPTPSPAPTVVPTPTSPTSEPAPTEGPTQ